MTFLKKILLIDYEPRVSALVREALEASGSYQVREEQDARLAVSAARWFQPDLILFDIAHAQPDPDTVARQLQEDPALKNTPVLFLSINPEPEGGTVSGGGILGGYSFFANPVRLDEFVRYVAELVRPTRFRDRNRQDALAS